MEGIEGKVRGKKYSCTGKSLRARNKGVSTGTVNREPCHVVMSLGTDTNLSTQTFGAGQSTLLPTLSTLPSNNNLSILVLTVSTSGKLLDEQEGSNL